MRELIRRIYRKLRPVAVDYRTKRLSDLLQLPRYAEGRDDLLGFIIHYPDAASYVYMLREIFDKEIYRFETKDPAIRIIDCGANIGMSALYFRKLYPSAEILAFEPDPGIFKFLSKNTSGHRIELHNSAVWSDHAELEFFSEGADAGKIQGANGDGLIKVTAVPLKDFLQKRVDLLKIDIEGAEVTVLEACRNDLANVQRIFVEYHSFLEKEQQLDRLLEILRLAGFRYNINHIGVVSRQPFVSVNSYAGMDLQLNIFAWRE